MSAEPVQRTLDLGDVSMRITELGDGPPVVLCHGFPGLGYSWRHQLGPLADAGFRAIAPDMLGYGASSAPADPGRYVNSRISADLVALLDALGEQRAVFVGHDFGAPAAWNVALRTPQRTAGLVLVSVPYDPRRPPVAPSELFAQAATRHFLHTHYFQQPGVADAELGADPRGFLARLLYALSGEFRYVDIWAHPSAGRGYLDVLPAAPPLPWPWLGEAEFDHVVEVFTRTGFTGGLNWYRAMDANWSDAEFDGCRIEVPTVFVAGSNEPVLSILGSSALDAMRPAIPDLRGVHLVDGAGHWVAQERPAAVNDVLVAFAREVFAGS